MNWAQSVVEALKQNNVSLITFVPDISIDKVTRLMEDDSYFQVIAATREEEAIGIAGGAYAVGRNAAVFMQSSGFGNTVNAIASLLIPCRMPIPVFINLRGEIGEFNLAQVPMGRATRPILDVLGIPYHTLTETAGVDQVVSGALKMCFNTRHPVALCMTPQLHGGKLA